MRGAQPVALVDYLRLATGYLEKSGSDTARLDAEVLLGAVLCMDRMSLYVNFDRPLEPHEVDAYRDALRRRGRGEPVAYITGSRAFRTLTLAVTPAVLIPRPETELLVEAVLARLPEGPAARALRVADVGTGSGAIAVSLAVARPDVRLVGIDISAEALAVAQANAKAAGVEERICFVHGDLLAPVLSTDGAGFGQEGLEAVVSNPPYVASAELERLARDVKDFEPRVALDGGPDGLAVYRRLIPQAGQVLKAGGLLALEIGADQGSAIVDVLRAAGGWDDVNVLQDYADHDRVIVARRAKGDE